MSMEEQFKGFMDVHKESIKMAMLHGNFDKALEIVFSAGYHSAWVDAEQNIVDSDEVN